MHFSQSVRWIENEREMCETLHLMRQIILNTHSFIIAVKTNIYDLWTLNSLPPLDINYWVFNNDNFLCSYYRAIWPRIHLMDDSKIMLHKLKLSKVTNQHSIAQQRHYGVHSMNVIFFIFVTSVNPSKGKPGLIGSTTYF